MFLKKLAIAVLAAGVVLTSVGCGLGGSLTVPAGTARPDGFQTIGGSITVEDGASVERGKLSTMKGDVMVGNDAKVNDIDVTNGSITIGNNSTAERVTTGSGNVSLGDGSTVRSLETAKGNITVGMNSSITNNVKTGSGTITMGDQTTVGGNVESTRGQITLNGTQVTGNVIAHAKGLTIDNGARVEGYVHFKKAAGVMEGKDVPTVIIGKNTVIPGTVTFDRDVKLYVHASANTGQIAGAEPNIYTGDAPEMETESAEGETME